MYVQNTAHFCARPRCKRVNFVDEGSMCYSCLPVSSSFSISSTLVFHFELVDKQHGMASWQFCNNLLQNCRVGGATVVQGNGVNTCPEPGQPRDKGMTQAIIRFTLTGEHCRWRFFFPPLLICIFARDCGAHPVLFAQQERPPVRATGNFCGM